MLFGAKLAAARAVGAASRRSGRGGGTTLPGRVLLRLAPDAIARLGAAPRPRRDVVSADQRQDDDRGDDRRSLAAEGRPPVHNRAGSNMTWGVATALLEQRGEEGLFEVDEAWLPRVTRPARALADRARQPLPRPARPLRRDGGARRRVGKTVAARARDAAASRSTPTTRLIADLGRDRERAGPARASSTSASRTLSQALPELQHAFDAKHCRRCGHPYAYERAFVGHLGHYSCPNCGAERPRPDVAATRDRAARDGRARWSTLRTPAAARSS